MDWSKQNNMAAKINFKQLKEEVAASYEANLKKEAVIFAQEILKENLDQYINEIQDHPVSKELDSGPDGENISNTLNGKENLFAFIGFDSQDEPVNDLTNLIKQNTFLDKKSIFDRKTFQLKFNVFTPSLDEIKSQTPLPFERGRSWVKGVEDGISGFGYYVYGLVFPSSRSGRGIQSKNKVRVAAYRPVKYMTELYAKFIKNLK
jgi:hypothetical protein